MVWNQLLYPLKLCDLSANDISNPGINFYTLSMQRNFFVLVESCKHTEGQRMNISSDIFFYVCLNSFKKFGLKALKTLSNGAANLLFRSPLHVNSFIKNNDFKQENFKAHISRSCTERFGTIRSISMTYDVNKFIEKAVSGISIKSAIGLRRRNPDYNNEFLSTASVKLGFEEKSPKVHKIQPGRLFPL